MTKKKKILLTVGIILGIIAILSLHLLAFFLKPPSANKVFSNNTSCIVELKCVTESVGESYGTAEILTKEGKLITNAHVVTYTKAGVKNEFEQYFIRFAFEEDYRSVTLLKYNADLDIAVLQFVELPTFKIKPISIGNMEKVKQGNKVYAVGNGQNQGLAISQGIIGIPFINIEYEDKARTVIQCDLTINEGNSGGALLDEYGKLIGITTFRTKDNKGNVIYGLAYCIPIDVAMEYVNAL